MSGTNKNSVIEKLQSLDNEQLQKMLVESARKLGQAQKQIEKKDKLIAEFTSQRERTRRRAESIIDNARLQAEQIKAESQKAEKESQKRIDSTNAEIAQKLANANAEADSIVESKLAKAKKDIKKLESQRDEAKRTAIQLNKNIIERYDELISDVQGQLAGYKDIQDKLDKLNVDIESESFTKFDINDFIASSNTGDNRSFELSRNAPHITADEVQKAQPARISLNDDELKALNLIMGDTDEEDNDVTHDSLSAQDDNNIFFDADDIVSEPKKNAPNAPARSSNPSSDDDFLSDALNLPPTVTSTPQTPDGHQKQHSDNSSPKNDSAPNSKVVLDDKTFKSFTDNFPVVSDKDKSDDADFDLNDIDIDALLDDDNLDDLMKSIQADNDVPTPKSTVGHPQTPQLTVPKRRSRSGNGHPAQWLS